MEKQALNVTIHKEQHDKLLVLKEETDLSISWHVRKAIDAYLREQGMGQV